MEVPTLLRHARLTLYSPSLPIEYDPAARKRVWRQVRHCLRWLPAGAVPDGWSHRRAARAVVYTWVAATCEEADGLSRSELRHVDGLPPSLGKHVWRHLVLTDPDPTRFRRGVRCLRSRGRTTPGELASEFGTDPDAIVHRLTRLGLL
ncbi:MAG: hypothetical protein U0871_10900 [Gemmataceae bacterium]